MKKYVALLRGINVGKAKRVAMADLRALMEELGYLEVQTLLNSGNVVFSVQAKLKGDHAKRIQQGISEQLGVSARVLVISGEVLEKVVAENPLAEVSDPARYLVSFVHDAADLAKLAPLQQQSWEPDLLAVGSHAAYLWCASGILESKLQQAVSRLLGDGTTARNWTTVSKLHALLAEA
ncbi:MAG: DUF1697 domain-containing protein [Pseudomonadota bacterium]